MFRLLVQPPWTGGGEDLSIPRAGNSLVLLMARLTLGVAILVTALVIYVSTDNMLPNTV